MEPSNSRSGGDAVSRLRHGDRRRRDATHRGWSLWDRAALGGIGLGLGLYVMPWWAEGRLKWAFWLTFASTVLHMFTSRRRTPSLPTYQQDEKAERA